jgi:2-polyprenyl-3-methyl-5-hydroxy-6-metoxy-1,4-benzoquinol methylase
MKQYNTTQLNPETSFERHIFHRDQFAHYLRWTHVLRLAKIGMNILDFGCGSGNLYEVLYRNRFSPKSFTGLDIRSKTIEKNKEKFPKADWQCKDLVNLSNPYGSNWDMIASFEVLEHVGKENGEKFMDNIANCCNENTIVLISTPVYDEKVGAAENHIYNGQVQEYTYDEAKELFEKRFTIEKKFGTFASVKDYKSIMNESQLEMYDKLHEYYDSNLLSIMFAPLFPEQSRNVIWQLKIKK